MLVILHNSILLPIPFADAEGRQWRTKICIKTVGNSAKVVHEVDGQTVFETKVGSRVMAIRRLRVYGDSGGWSSIVNGDLGSVVRFQLDNPKREFRKTISDGSSKYYPVVRFDSGTQMVVFCSSFSPQPWLLRGRSGYMRYFHGMPVRLVHSHVSHSAVCSCRVCVRLHFIVCACTFDATVLAAH